MERVLMKKVIIFVAILVAFLFLASSCNLIVKDAEVDKSTVIIDVNGKTITKEEVNTAIENQIQMESFYYQMQYGQALDVKDQQFRDAVTDIAIQNLINEAVSENKIKELGLDVLNEEENKTIAEEAQAEFDKNFEAVKTAHFAETTLKDDELKNAVLAKLEELHYSSLEDIIKNKTHQKQHEKLRNEVIKNDTVSAEEINTEYNTLVENAKQAYLVNPSKYGTDVLQNTDIYYRPAGYRNVRQVLVKLSEEDLTKLNELNTSIKTKKEQIQSIENSKALLKEDNEEDKAQLDSYNESLTQYTSELTALETEKTTFENEAFSKLDSKLNEIKTALAAKTDFSTLIEKYNEDPGMTVSPTKETGYPVTNGFVGYDTVFTETAMALQNIGDISEPTKGNFGYYIIEYTSDVQEGPVDYETVSEKISAKLLETKNNATYTSQLEKWVEEANAKIYKNKLK